MIFFSVSSSNSSHYYYSSVMCSLFLLKIWLYSSLLSIVLMWLYESKKWTVFTLGYFLQRSLWGDLSFMSQYYFLSLWFLINVFDYSEVDVLVFFSLIKTGPLKVHVSKFSLMLQQYFLNSLLSSSHSILFYFGYGGEKLFGLWKYLDWYSLPVCLCTNWRWLVPFILLKVFPKFMLIMVQSWL